MESLTPLVSVIIATYNRPKYLKLSIESVINQTYSNIEIIVVDDGSPNNESYNVCKSYKTVNYFQVENSKGPAKPRNLGISKAEGKYIAILDDDDLWLPFKIEEQVALLENNSDFGLVHGYGQVINNRGLKTDEIIGKPGTPDVKKGDVSLKMLGNWTLMTSSVMFKKELIKRVGNFNETMPPAGEDVEFWIRCSFFTKIVDIGKVVFLYRKHEVNISKNNKLYINLPLHLKKVIDLNLNKNVISNNDYAILNKNLCIMQLKMINLGFFKIVKNMFEINSLWFLDFRLLKLLTKKMIFE